MEKLNIICFGAHPDDCEVKAGGIAAKWAEKGHKVKFVSLTNGDIGHILVSGPELVKRRLEEAADSAKILGIEYEIMDNHDGELMPTVENRKAVTKLIREWKADIVLTPRTNDYHPDHRYTGMIVQDASFMVVVPQFYPQVMHLAKSPVFMLFEDRFTNPNKFQPDIIVSIDDIIEKKLASTLAHVSQFIERDLILNNEHMNPTKEAYERSKQNSRNMLLNWFKSTAEKYRSKLIEIYGEEKGRKIKFAEAFELSEYGSRPHIKELRKLFPE
jgi:LmbE family N-acetylglucosaminyl deacetylase